MKISRTGIPSTMPGTIWVAMITPRIALRAGTWSRASGYAASEPSTSVTKVVPSATWMLTQMEPVQRSWLSRSA